MNCRKCGARRVTKRAAGVFHCVRCGMQPGIKNFDRAGNPTPRAQASARTEKTEVEKQT